MTLCDFPADPPKEGSGYRLTCSICDFSDCYPTPRAFRKCNSRGLGDTLAKAARKVGIKPCGGCKKRQAMLNKLVRYGEKS